ncbi:hypothetical protein GALMADRAFT_152096 [Galerina marginata CBS 339.88]|uniref:DRBM domain-containing protein n=1 Tax=Galerina marginata (strain CBS 339.88) TaxID=685588 RepID=A0A067TIS2_GALM3|nr:hypothetical protein GALMADRAFT_152096 [Galerina marginata CBS 339.88]
MSKRNKRGLVGDRSDEDLQSPGAELDYREDSGSRGARGPQNRNDDGHSTSSPVPDPLFQRSCDIYYRLMVVKGRGSPMRIPAPNQNLDISYQREGTTIGDVGIVTASGSFDFLFNICLPHDHPINPLELPENFTTLAISPLDIQRQAEFVGQSYLSSNSVKKSRSGNRHGLTFESSASEGAILTMPVGSNSADIRIMARFRQYLADNVKSWYKYVLGVRGRELHNGDVLLVTGWDKTKTWGMATFSNTTAQEESCLLQFRPILMADSGITYDWEYSGSADVRAGPGAQEQERLRMGDPSQIGMEYENQCLFIRSLSATLHEEDWKKLAQEFKLVENDASGPVWPTDISNVSYSQPWRGNTSGRYPPSRSSQPSSASGSMGRTNVTFPPFETEAHPSKGINNVLLKLNPNARIAITADEDWLSVLRVDDTVLPTTKQLYERIMESSVVCEDGDMVYLQKKGRFFDSRKPLTTPELDLDSAYSNDNDTMEGSSITSDALTAVEKTTVPLPVELFLPSAFESPSKALRAMASSAGGSNTVTSLNNYLHNTKKLHTLMWVESYTGPANQLTWTVHCKIEGEIKGTGKGRSISEAKQVAAGQALEALLVADAAERAPDKELGG